MNHRTVIFFALALSSAQGCAGDVSVAEVSNSSVDQNSGADARTYSRDGGHALESSVVDGPRLDGEPELDGEPDSAIEAGDANPCTRDAGLGVDGRCGEEQEDEEEVGPFSIALMVANVGSLTPQERSLTGMLEGNGHTVTPFTVTTEPVVNAVNNPTIDLLLFSPSFEFSLLYHPAQPNALPMLDMARYSWYRRYVLPWNNEIAGQRFSGRGETSQQVYYESDDVIAWNGQQAGPVEVLTAPRFAGEAPMRRALEHSTGGGAQYFLRHMSDTAAESALGVYVPPGSTITEPAPTTGQERRIISVAPWIGLLVFIDDPGNGNQYAELTPAGEGLFEAAMRRLMNP